VRPSVVQSALVICLAIVAAGCGDVAKSSMTVPPAPDTSRMETGIGEKIDAGRSAVLADPLEAISWGNLGMIFDANGFVDETIICYHQASGLAPADPVWPYLEARVLASNRPGEADAAFERALDLGPTRPIIWMTAADAAINNGDLDAARTRYQRVAELAPDAPYGHFGLARVAIAEGRLDEARDRLETAVSNRWDYRQAHLLLAEVLQRSGSALEAERHRMIAANSKELVPANPYSERIMQHGVGAEWSKRRGLALAAEGNHEAAADEFRQAAKQAPQDPTHLVNLGLASAALDRHDDAIAAYRAALEVNPNLFEALINLGVSLFQTRETDEAKGIFERIIEIDPQRDPEALRAYRFLAAMDAAQGDLDGARAHLEAGLRIRPGDPTTLTRLGRIEIATDHIDRATELYRRTFEMDPGATDTTLILAELMARSGRHDEAIQLLREGLARSPGNTRIEVFLAWELATAPDEINRDGREAVQIAERLYQRNPDDFTASDVFAAALAENGNFDSAVMIAELSAASATAGGNADAARAVETRLALYRRGLPFHQ